MVNEASALRVSVVVPVKDEAENVAPLVREIVSAVQSEGPYEIIFVDDGSTDETVSVLTGLKAEIPQLRVLSHERNIGQSRGIRTGVRAAKAPLIVTLDGDGQNDPADIPKLLAIFRDNQDPHLGLVSGVRVKRQDSIAKKLASTMANNLRRNLLNDLATDVGCGLKAFRKDAFLALPYFDHIHRYLIALMLREGYEVSFVNVRHRPRLRGQSKYGVLDRLLVGISDLLGVMWLLHRFRGPAHPREL